MIQLSIISTYDTQAPTRGTAEAAGLDVYLPAFNEQFRKDFEKFNPRTTLEYGKVRRDYIEVPGEGRVVLPTGLRVVLPPNTYLEVANRGSMAAKYGLIFGAHIIDADYRGNIFINLINTSQLPRRLEPGQKIAQFLHKPVLMSEVVLIDDTAFEKAKTVRGTNALGSTGA